ncbi:hypothetical protein Hanom_Chr05g00471581 [Helianthus anomalus]
MSRRILELEMTLRPLPCPCQPAFVPPRSSLSPFSHPPVPLTPFPEFDTRFFYRRASDQLSVASCL